ncbi:formylglycine-generating enzyme family protein [Flammeovirga agarivorans]|uniref:SUMF1/EgtB/PvdO family nonheme iron enzyme n=1 Tax=Flammeovirga agarivorans TaxID=2726742 RepID=A0A7X8XXW1_9BACT|nr:SUMF1/EgtB/PvdO family nonheme iron enzyme [Flammeovirga agarivorans]NLR93631.1 SUMF1/EgtB/PvdO family nonheme iron enzyme [Flammeovirga agarivorans]
MNKNYLPIILSLFIVFISMNSNANNLQISGLTVAFRNTTDKTITLDMNVSWDNSWKLNSDQSNWDAVWLFVKYRKLSEESWHHATLTHNSGHSAMNGTIVTDDDTGTGFSKGIFLYASNEHGQQSVDYDVTLQWEYGEDGQSDDDTFEFRVYGIEMVYIPAGQFYLGTDGNETDAFYTYNSDLSENPYLVANENAITVGQSDGNLYYSNSSANSSTIQDGTIPSNYPKGYDAFYCMKYEITQGQYADFLNTLTDAQLGNSKTSGNVNFRDRITLNGDDYVSNYPYLPVNIINSNQILAYLDWAAIRPMTELEFEKACRGNQAPVENENPWGDATAISSAITLTDADLSTEVVSTGYSNVEGNANYLTIYSTPVRVGIFSSNANSRMEAGATYYGILDMGGNVYETVISAGTSMGRLYEGSHGDGTLDSNGFHDVSDWPSASSNTGIGQRGGSYRTNVDHMRVSNRIYAALYNTGNGYSGGRGVRTAP